MNKPEKCNDDVYKIMLLCWKDDPKGRPTFKEVNDMILNMMNSMNGMMISQPREEVVVNNIEANMDIYNN